MIRALLLTLLAAACSASQPASSSAAAPVPPLPILDAVDDLVAGLSHTCALRKGAVLCWGQSLTGDGSSSVAQAIAGLPPIVALSSAGRRVCMLDAAGQLFCVGEIVGEPTGRPRGEVQEIPLNGPMPADLAIRWGGLTRLDFGQPITQVAVAMTHICAVTKARELYCWGSASGGQLDADTSMAAPVLLAEKVDSVEVGFGWTCYAADGKPRCRGSRPHLGDAAQQQWTQFPGWLLAACGVTSDGHVQCHGDGTVVTAGGAPPPDGGLAILTIPGLDDVQRIAVGANHACAVKNDGSVWCWGDDTFNQTMHAPTHAPTQIALPGPATHLAAGMDHTCAVVEPRGEVVCWGRNDQRQAAGTIALGPTQGAGAIPVLTIRNASALHERQTSPTPAKLDGTAWTACVDKCGACAYTLTFAAGGDFVADGSCPSLNARTHWTGRWTRTGDHVVVHENPAPAGTRWEWQLDLRGQALSGERRTAGMNTVVSGHLKR